VCLVSESGIRTRADLDRLKVCGVRAVLVGETLMRAEDIGGQLDALRGRGRGLYSEPANGDNAWLTIKTWAITRLGFRVGSTYLGYDEVGLAS
jgi:Indole-3-glycerol phosphate synthase